MTTNSQLSTTEPKKKQKQTKQTTRTGTESQKWRSHGGLSVGRRNGKSGRKGTENKKHEWQVQNRQGKVNNSRGYGEAKRLICTTHGHELRWGNAGGSAVQGRDESRRGKIWDKCNSIINKIYSNKMLLKL